MWTTNNIRRVMLLRKAGHAPESIGEVIGVSAKVIERLFEAVDLTTPEIKRFEVDDPDTEIQNLIEYIPQAPPFFKDIAIQRLKQLC